VKRLKPDFVKILLPITALILIFSFFECQKNSTFVETPVIIENQVFNLPENSPAGTVIGQVDVKNTSATGLNYYLVLGEYSNAFRMETSTGKLILKDSSLINYEVIKQINLEVMVGYENSNKNFGVFANVLVQVEDNLDPFAWVSDGVSGKNQVALVNSLQPDSNLKPASYLYATAWTNNLQPFATRSFMFFDLTAIPSDVEITRATLSLYNPKDGDKEHEQSCFSGPNTFCFRRVTSQWNTQTITWNNQPAFSVVGQVIVPACQTKQQDCEKIDISEIVQYMVKYPAENHGFIMMLENENYYRRLCFASLDYPDEKLRPKLEINYLK
jgi:hypothetical protein